MNVRMSCLPVLAMICFQTIKSDDIHIQSILRKIRLIKNKEKYPYFNELMPSKIRAAKGEEAVLTCIVENVANQSISWIRNRDLHILTVNDYVFTNDRRFEIVVESQTHWSLKINNAQLEDVGIYECQISTQPISIFSVYLTVFDRRYFNPIEQFLDYSMEIKEERRSSGVVNDDVAELLKPSREDTAITRILEGYALEIQEGSTLNITCDVYVGRGPNRNLVTQTERRDPNLYLVWLHNNKIISDGTSHDGTLVLTKNSSKLIRSRLLILNTFLNDSGTYTCHPFKFNKAVIKVHIKSGMQLLVPSVIILALLSLCHIIYNGNCNHYL